MLIHENIRRIAYCTPICCTPNKSQSHSNRRNIEVSGNNDKQICWQGYGCYGHPTSDCNSYTQIPFVWTSMFSKSCQKDGNKVRQLQHWSNTVFANFKPLNCLKQCLQFGSHSLHNCMGQIMYSYNGARWCNRQLDINRITSIYTTPPCPLQARKTIAKSAHLLQ